MKITFLGTGNASGIPSPFCNCDTCFHARIYKGKDVRLRSSILIDGDLLIDITPDFFSQSLNNGLYMNDLKHILITHTHTDHFNPSEIYHSYISQSIEKPKMDVYLSNEAYDAWEIMRRTTLTNSYMKNVKAEGIRFHRLTLYQKTKMSEKWIVPIPSTHQVSKEELGFNYVIEGDGRVILYATDTNSYTDETVIQLQSWCFDLIIIDGNDAFDHNTTSNHNSFYVVRDLVERLRCNEEVLIYFTHISHQSYTTHDELEKRVQLEFGNNFRIAYDGKMLSL